MDKPIIRIYGSANKMQNLVAISAFNTNSTDQNGGLSQIAYSFNKDDFDKIISPLVD